MTSGAKGSLERGVVISGGGAGIGRATAMRCAELGAPVAILDRDEARAQATAREIGGIGLRCDVSDEDDVARAFTAVIADMGSLGGLVTCAGVDASALSHELDRRRWEQVISVNLLGTHLCTQAALRHLIDVGSPGSIVCVSSPAAFVAIPGGGTAYSASKGGVSALVRTLAVDYAPRGIRVNAIVPGATETELMWANVEPGAVPQMRETIESEVPLGRLARPVEVAAAAVWLLGDDASYVTGSHLVCDGGVLARSSVST